jgi:hypothetical protein
MIDLNLMSIGACFRPCIYIETFLQLAHIILFDFDKKPSGCLQLSNETEMGAAGRFELQFRLSGRDGFSSDNGGLELGWDAGHRLSLSR